MVDKGGHGSINGTDYVTHLAQVEVASWKQRAQAGLKQIPTVSAGADDRPRSEYPMPWGAKVRHIICCVVAMMLSSL